jgi:hypothetical protein
MGELRQKRMGYSETGWREEAQRVQVSLDAYCWTCKVWHKGQALTPDQFTREVWAWQAKHPGHAVEFLSPRRRFPRRLRDWLWRTLGPPWWLYFRENENTQLAYGQAARINISLAALATSANFTAGQESDIVNNELDASTHFLDVRVTAKITTGTTPTADKDIRVYGHAALDDTNDYVDALTGKNAPVTITNTYIVDTGLVPLGSSSNSGTSNITYFPGCITLQAAFGHVPKRWGIYVTHSTAVNLNATPGLHALSYIPAYLTNI